MNLTVAKLIESAAIVSCHASIGDAVDQMHSQSCDRVYVTDEIGHISSVVCDYRLLKAQIRGERSQCSIQQYAAPITESLNPSQPLTQAAVFFRSGFQTELPVFEGHQFLGVIRRTSLLSALMNSAEGESEVAPQSQIAESETQSTGPSLNRMPGQNSLKFG